VQNEWTSGQTGDKDVWAVRRERAEGERGQVSGAEGDKVASGC
jgi:hypothetical protein